MKSIQTLLLLAILSVLFVEATGERESFLNYHVITVSASKSEDLLFLQNEAIPIKLDIWGYGHGEDGLVTATFHVHPDLVASILQKLDSRGLQYDIVNTNLQRDIDIERTTSGNKDMDYTHYYTFDELQVWLEEQVVACGSQCSIVHIGNSFEGRPLNVIKLTGVADPTCQEKPVIWIDAGIHAREWISVSTGMYLIDKLIVEYGQVETVTRMRDDYDWYILPSVNPDGYVWSWDSYRMWRKSRQPVADSTCIGADINRNFEFMWMTVGASQDPCDETFAGYFPNSEPEAMYIEDFLLSFTPASIDLFITLHSYGQLWMCPWGYTTDLPASYDELARVGEAAVQTILETSGMVYTFGSATEILYASSGTSRDWAMGVPAIPYVYTIELRSLNSFILPATQIEPTGAEIWAALQTTMTKIWEVRPPTCVTPVA